jgi:hypothetical protein
LSALAVAAGLATGLGHTPRTLEAAVIAPCGTDMRVLVISANGAEPSLQAITRTLDHLGTPYTLHVASQARGTLTADRLSNDCHANYQAVIVATGLVDNAWSGVLTATELQALHTFESQFKVRQVVGYTFPNDFGLTFTGTTVSTIGAPPLQVSLTPAGTAMFPYINLGARTPAKPLVVEQAIAYLAQPVAGSATTPIIIDAAGNTLAAVTTTSDGREVLALTFDSNRYSLQTLLFGYGIVNWATRGVFVGERKIYMSAQVDDVLIADDRWLDGTSCSLVGKDLSANGTGPTVRMTGTDMLAAAAWQIAKNRQPTTANLRMTMAINGWGATGIYRRDTLTPIARWVSPLFYWVSHTYDHPTLDGMGYAAAKAEFTMNNDIARQLRLFNYSATSAVTPNISGLRDAEVMQAALDAGVRYVVTDSSQPGQDSPTPNVGIYNWMQPQILMIPRRPVNLFYNVSTPAEWTSEYNCIYRDFFGRDLTYQEILDFNSNQLLPYLLGGENRPWMFHQSNLVAYDGRRSLLSDLLDATLAKYNGYFTLPILSPSMDALGRSIEARMKLQSAQVTATLQPGVSLTLASNADVTVPVAGLAATGAETYGGQPIARVNVKAGVPLTVPLSMSTPSVPAPKPLVRADNRDTRDTWKENRQRRDEMRDTRSDARAESKADRKRIKK